jgi:hypothetical protein
VRLSPGQLVNNIKRFSMKSKIPKGLFVFTGFLIIGSIYTIRYLFKPDPSTIIFAHIIAGNELKIYYTIFLVLNCIIAVSLLFYLKWSYFLYFTLSAFHILSMLTNILFIDTAIFAELSWKMKIPLHSLVGFRITQCIIIILHGFFIYWLYSYRRLYFSENN